MRKTCYRLALIVMVVGVSADVALAAFLPSPFSFSFFTPGLTSLFLWPFALAGCG